MLNLNWQNDPNTYLSASTSTKTSRQSRDPLRKFAKHARRLLERKASAFSDFSAPIPAVHSVRTDKSESCFPPNMSELNQYRRQDFRRPTIASTTVKLEGQNPDFLPRAKISHPIRFRPLMSSAAILDFAGLSATLPLQRGEVTRISNPSCREKIFSISKSRKSSQRMTHEINEKATLTKKTGHDWLYPQTGFAPCNNIKHRLQPFG